MRARNAKYHARWHADPVAGFWEVRSSKHGYYKRYGWTLEEAIKSLDTFILTCS